MGKTYNARYKLTLMPDGRRWRKKYRGRFYYFARKKGETERQSYGRCVREWEALKANLIAAERSAAMSDEQKALLPSIRVVEHGYEYSDDGDAMEKIVVDFPPGTVLGPGADQVGEYAARLMEETAATLIDQKESRQITVKDEIRRQTKAKDLQAQSGGLAHKTAKRYKEKLDHFARWVGENSPIANVSGRVLLDYHALLLDEVTTGKRTPGGAKTQFQAVRQLLNTAYVSESIPKLPKILAVRNNLLSFGGLEARTDPKQERNWADELDAFKVILAGAEGRLRLYLLLMANCGYQQTDISELGQTEVDWKKGRIARKRSKGRNRRNVPEVDYLLWQGTFALLKQYKAPSDAEPNVKGGPRALVNANGTALVNARTDTDAIQLAYERLLSKLKIKGKSRKPLAAIRKTSSTLLGRGPYADCRHHFLGHAPDNMADRHYSPPNQEQLDRCILWLGEQYGVT